MSNILTNNINPRSGNLITIGGTNDRVSIAGTLSYEDVANIDSVGIITAQSGIRVTGGDLSIEGSASQILSIFCNATGVQATPRTFINLYGDNTANEKKLQAQIASAPGNTASSAGELHFSTNNSSSVITRRMTINQNGYIGIGTDNPTFSSFGSNTGGVAIQDIGATNTGLKIGDGSNTAYLIAAGNGNYYQSHYGSGSMIFGVGNGTGTERMRILSSGGITFNGDTAAANALDDYEEGTFTATPDLGSCTATNCVYQRVGNLVTCKGYLSAFSNTNSSSDVNIEGLPFTIIYMHHGGAIMGNYIGNNDYGSPFSSTYANLSGQGMRFYGVTTGFFDYMRHSDLSSNSSIYFTFSYFVST